MAEWFKAAVLKTVVPRGTVGSNPTPSAMDSVDGSFFTGKFIKDFKKRNSLAF